MPNAFRLDCPGSLHHVMSHCVEGCRALDEDGSKADFLNRVSYLVGKGALRIHAWALMPNHYHLLTETTEVPLAVSMQRLLTGFSSAYNRKNNRRGHVFDARFRSILVERESYFLKLVQYINLNPLKGGIVSTLDELEIYPWTGYSALMGRSPCQWMRTDILESLLGSSRSALQDRCIELHRVDPSGNKDDCVMDSGSFSIGSKGLKEQELVGAVSPHSRAIRILGTKDFALQQYSLYRKQRGANLRNRHEQHVAMELLLAMIAERTQIPVTILRSGGRGKRLSRARKQLAGELVRISGVTQADVASFLKLSQAAVSQMLDQTASEDG